MNEIQSTRRLSRLFLSFCIGTLVITQATSAEDPLITDNGVVEDLDAVKSKASDRKKVNMGAEGRREHFSVPANTPVVRIKLYLDAHGDGFAPILAWEDMVLAASLSEGVWQFYCTDPELAELWDTQFLLAGEDFPGWITIVVIAS